MLDEKYPVVFQGTLVNQPVDSQVKKARFLLKLTNRLLTKNNNLSDDQERVIEFEDMIDAWIDTTSSLMWEIKTEENINHRYVVDRDYYHNSRHMHLLTDSVKDAISYVHKLNKVKFAGFDDWRIPTIEELKTLKTKKETNEYYIKVPLSKNSCYFYMSASELVNSHGIVSIMHYSNGFVSNTTKHGNYSLRCVRGGKLLELHTENEYESDS